MLCYAILIEAFIPSAKYADNSTIISTNPKIATAHFILQRNGYSSRLSAFTVMGHLVIV